MSLPSPSRQRFSAHEIARLLASHALAICRRCLSNGRREGALWRVGDLGNAKGRSLFVRLSGPKAGRWLDAATGEHGDLLDLIAQTMHGGDLRAALRSACAFLALPDTGTDPTSHFLASASAPQGSCFAEASPDTVALARRIWGRCRPIGGTLAEAYLRSRALGACLGGLADGTPLRFHPALPWRLHADAPFERHPALVAAVTDDEGAITGVHRTWLDPAGGKAKVAEPRRSLGRVLGHAVQFPPMSPAGDATTLIVGEGIETVLSLRDIMPIAALAACLSAAHLAAFRPPAHIHRLVIARDNGQAGRRAARRLADRMPSLDVAVVVLRPVFNDFNDDRRQLGLDQLCENIARTMVAIES